MLFGGDEENRTPDPLLARQVLSQLSYTPKLGLKVVLSDFFSLSAFAPAFPSFSYENESQLSYTPKGDFYSLMESPALRAVPSKLNNTDLRTCEQVLLRTMFASLFFFLRKEVIQPHLPIRLPCYDLTLIINPTFGGVLLAVRLPTSGVANSHGLTGGVYKARERIHRSMLTYDY